MNTEHSGLVTESHLENGLTVLFMPIHNSPVVAVQIWIDIGSADEQTHEKGAAHLIEHMLFKGTKRHKVGELAGLIEESGGDINAWTSFDHTAYHLILPPHRLNLGLDLLADAVRYPSFNPDELQKEKTVVLEEIKRTRDLPERWIGDLIFEIAYQKHPYRHSILGTEKSLGKLDRKTLLSFHKHHYIPHRMTLLVVGSFEQRKALRQIDRWFGSIASRNGRATRRMPENPQKKPRVRLFTGDLNEAYFQLAWHIPAVDHNDIAALDALSILLGQGESSRYNLGIKQKHGLVNDIYAMLYTSKDPGLFLVGGSTRPRQLVSAFKELAAETTRVAERNVLGSELSKVKSMLEAEALYQQETVEGQAHKLGYNQILLGDPSYTESYLRKIFALNPQEIQRIAKKYLGPETYSAVVLISDNLKENLDKPSIVRGFAEGFQPGRISQDRSRNKKAPPTDVKKVVVRNGPTAVIQEDHRVGLVSVWAVGLGGLRYERASNNGINQLLARTITSGTTNRNYTEIAHEMDAIACTLEGFSGHNSFGLRADFPSRYLDRALDLFADCMLRPTFERKELTRERRLLVEAIRSRKDNPAALSIDLFVKTLYQNHPYHLALQGNMSSVRKLSETDLKTFFSNHYTQDRLVLSVVGDVEQKQLMTRLKSMGFGSIKSAIQPIPKVPTDPLPGTIRKAYLRHNCKQAHMVLGFMGGTVRGRDRIALEVLMTILCGQGGILFLELRDRLSLAYSVSGLSVEGLEPGYLAFYLGVDAKRIDEAIGALLTQLHKVAQGSIDKRNLLRAQEYLVGAHAISQQRSSNRAMILALNELYGLGKLEHLSYTKKVRSITLEQIKHVARKYIDLNAYCIAVVGPSKMS